VATRHWLGLLAVAGMDAGFGWLARHAARQRRELEAWREELKRLRRGPGGDRGRRREDKAIPLGGTLVAGICLPPVFLRRGIGRYPLRVPADS
jgi:hypothetical protein